MRPNNSLSKISGLSQEEKAIWLGVSRSEINMTERRERSLPTHAHLKLCRLEIAQHQLQASKQAVKDQDTPGVEACCALLQQHLDGCKRKFNTMESQLERLAARYDKLKRRQQTLDLMRSCSSPDCTEAAQKWLAHASFLNEHNLRRMQSGQLFMLQHRMNMLLAETTATEKILAKMRQSSTGATQLALKP